MSFYSLNFLQCRIPITDERINYSVFRHNKNRNPFVSDLALRMLTQFSTRLVGAFEIQSELLKSALVTEALFYRTVYEALMNEESIEEIPLVKNKLETLSAHSDFSLPRFILHLTHRTLTCSDEFCTFPNRFKIKVNEFTDLATLTLDQTEDLFEGIKLGYPKNPKTMGQFYHKHLALYRNDQPIPWILLAREWAKKTGNIKKLHDFENRLDLNHLLPSFSRETGDPPVSCSLDFPSYVIHETLREYESALTTELSTEQKILFSEEMRDMKVRKKIVYYLGHKKSLLETKLLHPSRSDYFWLLALQRIEGFKQNFSDVDSSFVAPWIISILNGKSFPQLEEKQARKSIATPIGMARELEPLLSTEEFLSHAFDLVFACMELDPRDGVVNLRKFTEQFPKKYCLFTHQNLIAYINSESEATQSSFDSRLTNLCKQAKNLEDLLDHLNATGLSEKFFPLARKQTTVTQRELVQRVIEAIGPDKVSTNLVLELLERVVSGKLTGAHLDLYNNYPHWIDLSIADRIQFFKSTLSPPENLTKGAISDAENFIGQMQTKYRLNSFQSLRVFIAAITQNARENETKIIFIHQLEKFMTAPVEGDFFTDFFTIDLDISRFPEILAEIDIVRADIQKNLQEENLPEPLIDQLKLKVSEFLYVSSKDRGPKNSPVKVNRIHPICFEVAAMVYSATLYYDDRFFKSLFKCNAQLGSLMPFCHESSLARIAFSRWDVGGIYPVYEMEIMQGDTLRGVAMRIPLEIKESSILEDSAFCEFLAGKVYAVCEEVSPLPEQPDIPEKYKVYDKALSDFFRKFRMEYRRVILEFALNEEPLLADPITQTTDLKIYPLAGEHFALVPDITSIYGEERQKALSSLDCMELYLECSNRGIIPMTLLTRDDGEPKKIGISWSCNNEGDLTTLNMEMDTSLGTTISHKASYPGEWTGPKIFRRHFVGFKARCYHEFFNNAMQLNEERTATPPPQFTQ